MCSHPGLKPNSVRAVGNRDRSSDPLSILPTKPGGKNAPTRYGYIPRAKMGSCDHSVVVMVRKVDTVSPGYIYRLARKETNGTHPPNFGVPVDGSHGTTDTENNTANRKYVRTEQ